MENENKTEEQKVEDSKIEENVAEIKTEEFGAKKTTASPKWNNQVCKEKMCTMWVKNKMTIIALIIILVLVGASIAYAQYQKKHDIGPIAAKAAVQKFVDANVPPGTKVELKDAVKEIGLYKIAISVSGQNIDSYVTLDGTKFFPQAIDLSGKDKEVATDQQQANQAPEKTEAEVKTDIPTVDLFVMSYCPYGLQMEKGFLPAVEVLGNKVKFNLKFVSYTLHGQKEVDENVNQYCIEKTQPSKLNAYLKCFWKDSKGSAAECMKAVGINANQISTCVASTNKQFSPTEKAFDVNKDENVKFAVQGSPTLVVNGTTVASGRDSASVLKAICSGFKNQPKECQAKLSTTSPSAGFDDQATAAAASSSTASASCATAQ